MKNNLHFTHWPERVSKTLTIPETTLYDNLAITTKKYPEKIAIHYYGASYTYREIFNQVEKLASYLENDVRVKQGDRVLLFMQNSPQYIIGLFAILRIRAIVVPINPMSTESEMNFYVEDGGITHALVGQELYQKVKGLHEGKQLDKIIIASYSAYCDKEKALGTLPPEVEVETETIPSTIAWEDTLAHDGPLTPYDGRANDIAMIPYTSGTTGEPKGCIHTNKTVQANTVGAFHWLNITPDAVALATLPLFHVTGLVHSGLTPIFAGSTIVLLTRWDREYTAKAIETYEVSHWINISTMVIDFLANPNIGSYNISSLELVGGGGAPLPKAVGEQLFKTTGLHYVEGYGLSETMSHTHFNPPHRPKLQCLGIPAFDVDARIIDLETGEEKGVGETGELIVHGPQLFKGYYNQQAANEESFITINGKSFFKTGDIVTMDEEGYFFLVDRVKRMINAAGFKVWPSEVESILYRHEAVQQACVVRAIDEKRGETVKALIILKENYQGEITEADVIEWAKTQMAAYKYPRIVEFKDSFPMTSSGKIMWRTLQDALMN